MAIVAIFTKTLWIKALALTLYAHKFVWCVSGGIIISQFFFFFFHFPILRLSSILTLLAYCHLLSYCLCSKWTGNTNQIVEFGERNLAQVSWYYAECWPFSGAQGKWVSGPYSLWLSWRGSHQISKVITWRKVVVDTCYWLNYDPPIHMLKR